MTNSRWKTVLRTVFAAAAFVLAGAYISSALRGPNGLPAMIEKRRQVRELQEQNANLQKEIGLKRDRIRRLRDSRSDQELEIRQRLKLLKEKETTFILQDQPKPESATPADANPHPSQ